MSDLLSIATIALAGIVQASLQLSLGGLILLYHASMGRHKKRKTRYLAKNYIIGACSISFVMVCALAFVIQEFWNGAMSQELMVILVGVLAACALVMWIGYYRAGKGTELWLPKSFSRFITSRAKRTNDRIEAFSLGMLSAFAEFPITAAIYFVVANCLLSVRFPLVAALVYVVIVAMPMIALKFNIKTGKNIIAAQKQRVKNKRFMKIFSGSGFAVLALFVMAFWVF